MNARQVKDCLKARHPAPEWVWAEEFNIGDRSDRRIDGLALNCFPSRGHVVVGYEIKVSRADFLQELKDPEKRRAAVEMCDKFYFAVPKGLVQPKEIPEDCGLIECWMGDSDSLAPEANPAPNSRLRLDRWAKKLARLEAKELTEKKLPRWFVAAVVRQFDPERQKLKHQFDERLASTQLRDVKATMGVLRAEVLGAWKDSLSP